MSNFIDFISKYSIEVPMIQRDYVQGLDRNREKRDPFLRAILNALRDDKPLSIDFIYGIARDNAFRPLDGQQRLTTLSLLALLLHSRQDRALEGNISRFTYDCRLWASQFVNSLFEHYRDIPADKASEAIRNQSWYYTEWDNDPTVVAILQVIDAMNKMLNSPDYKEHIPEMLDRFINGNLIEFELLDLDSEGYHRYDSLFIKMNARGKQLTDFENRKAAFIGFLGRTYHDFQARFEQSVEHEWSDMLWQKAYKQWNGDENRYPVTDVFFMRIFNYLSRMIYFSTRQAEKESDFDAHDFAAIYNSRDNVDLLFRSLDFIAKILPGDDFFNRLFYISQDDDNLRADRVRLFDSKSVNLIDLLLEDRLTNKGKLLLWAIIRLGISNAEVTPAMARAARNYVEATDRFEKNGIKAVSNVHMMTEMSKYVSELDKLRPDMNDDDLCMVEDLGYIRGSIRIFEGFTKSSAELLDALRKFMSLEDIDKQRALIRHGFHGMCVGWCGFGQPYFFGMDGHWNAIFRFSEDPKNRKAILATLAGEKDIELKPDTFAYYALKYDAILRTGGCAYFCADGDKGIDSPGITAFTTWGTRPLSSYHTGPFINAVYEAVNEEAGKKGHSLNRWVSGNQYDGLQIDGGEWLMVNEGKWKIGDQTFERRENEDLVQAGIRVVRTLLKL